MHLVTRAPRFSNAPVRAFLKDMSPQLLFFHLKKIQP